MVRLLSILFLIALGVTSFAGEGSVYVKSNNWQSLVDNNLQVTNNNALRYTIYVRNNAGQAIDLTGKFAEHTLTAQTDGQTLMTNRLIIADATNGHAILNTRFTGVYTFNEQYSSVIRLYTASTGLVYKIAEDSLVVKPEVEKAILVSTNTTINVLNTNGMSVTSADGSVRVTEQGAPAPTNVILNVSPDVLGIEMYYDGGTTRVYRVDIGSNLTLDVVGSNATIHADTQSSGGGGDWYSASNNTAAVDTTNTVYDFSVSGSILGPLMIRNAITGIGVDGFTNDGTLTGGSNNVVVASAPTVNLNSAAGAKHQYVFVVASQGNSDIGSGGLSSSAISALSVVNNKINGTRNFQIGVGNGADWEGTASSYESGQIAARGVQFFNTSANALHHVLSMSTDSGTLVSNAHTVVTIGDGNRVHHDGVFAFNGDGTGGSISSERANYMLVGTDADFRRHLYISSGASTNPTPSQNDPFLYGYNGKIWGADTNGNFTQLTTHTGDVHVAKSFNIWTGEGRTINIEELAKSVADITGNTNIITYWQAPKVRWEEREQEKVQRSIQARSEWQRNYDEIAARVAKDELLITELPTLDSKPPAYTPRPEPEFVRALTNRPTRIDRPRPGGGGVSDQ